jgi:hypothetical protein
LERFTVTNGLDGSDGNDGDNGADGQGVDHVSLTSTSGLVDTYTVWGDVGETINLGTFDVTNGADGQDGQDGASDIIGQIIIDISSMDAGNPSADRSGTITVGSGEDLSVGLFDSAVEEFLTFKLPVPLDWDLGPIKYRLWFTAISPAMAGNTVRGSLAVACGPAGSGFPAFALPVTVEETILGVDIVGKTPWSSALTVTGAPAQDSLMFIWVSRPVFGSMAADWPLISLEIAYSLASPRPSFP